MQYILIQIGSNIGETLVLKAYSSCYKPSEHAVIGENIFDTCCCTRVITIIALCYCPGVEILSCGEEFVCNGK